MAQHADTIPRVLGTERLILRLNDPDNDDDSRRIISLYTDDHANRGGTARVGINTLDDVAIKHKIQAPKQHYCTKAAAPRGMFHLVFLRDNEAGPDIEGTFLGSVCLTSRPEMPNPDLGYSFLKPSWGHGYAAEAGKASLHFWRDTIGVRNISLYALDTNDRSRKTANSIGFVPAGAIDVLFGRDETDWKRVQAAAYILPGMEWRGVNDQGERLTLYATIGTETDKQKRDDLSAG